MERWAAGSLAVSSAVVPGRVLLCLTCVFVGSSACRPSWMARRGIEIGRGWDEFTGLADPFATLPVALWRPVVSGFYHSTGLRACADCLVGSCQPFQIVL